MISSENTLEQEAPSYSRSRSGLYKTTWPLEHADVWRTQTTPSGGLPGNFNKDDLQTMSINLDQPFAGYTRDKDQVFVMGGMPYLMNKYTEMYMSHSTYASSAPVKGLIDDRQHIPYIAKLDPQTLSYTMVELTLGRNRAVNYPGGALMHRNGYVYALAQTILYKLDPNSMQILATLELPLVEGQPGKAISTIYNGLLVLSNGRIVSKCFTSDDIGQGWIVQIDPETLDLLVAKQIEVQSARLMLDEPEPGVAYAYAPTLSQSRRFLIKDDDFVLDEEWTSDYRDPDNASTTWANGTLFMKSHVVFPDNSAPGESISEPMHFFLNPVNHPPQVLQPHNAVSDQPGINFWKLFGDPYSNEDHGTIFTFTPTNEKIRSYRLFEDGTTELLWERAYFVSASPAVVTGQDLLYINDFRNGHDNLVVLRLSTGEELAYIPLPEAKKTTMGIIFPGMNNDVYLCSTETGEPVNSGIFHRIYLA